MLLDFEYLLGKFYYTCIKTSLTTQIIFFLLILRFDFLKYICVAGLLTVHVDAEGRS